MKCLLFLIVPIFFLSISRASTYYFSTKSGSDERTQKQAQNPATPWKTLDKLNSFSDNLQPGDRILFKRGETFFGSITINKSGTADLPIVFSAYGTGSKPVITSLVRLTNWTPVAGYSGVYESSDPSLGKNVNILLLNNTLQQLGRYPNANAANKGYLTFESHDSYLSITDNDLEEEPNWTGAQAVIRTARWKLDRVAITSHSGNTINYKSPSKSLPPDNYGYFIQNDIKTLDQFGEWYYDPSSKKMNVYFAKRNPASYVIQASTAPNLINSDNSENLVFDNLSVKGANNAGLRFNNSTNVKIQNCDVLFSGSTGVYTSKGSKNLTIENCNISYSNSWGIKLSSSINSIIRNNVIRNSGAIAGMGESGSSSYKGIEFGGSGNLVENNEVDSSGYMGIHFLSGENQTIKNNVINTFGFVKDDGGGIYTQVGKNVTIYLNRKVIGNIVLNGIGAQQGTNSPNSAANGIYMDDGANGVEITGNTVANTFRGIYLHNAFGIEVTDNTLYSNDVGCYMQHEGGANPVRNNKITNNTFFSKLPKQLAISIFTKRNDVDSIGVLDSNYYFRPFAKDDRMFRQTYKNDLGKNVTEMLSLNDWKSAHRKDPSSKLHPMKFRNDALPDDYIRFEYNPSDNNKTVSLAGNYRDVNNNLYTKSVVLRPYSSIILLKQPGKKFQ